ncbi:translocation/assembly module TamB domain-containing protein [Thermithiobacillus tepidarius DSM 3134]|uniref:translocation/assembly module TamB domain-containing protein n=1 Tax=Thermithiobacillus tepidarius TaxID=929 RepID=UPI000424E03A|nr:translocation/assembly module TamB domain-containing protein [Thermithiobacillus tepidarius]
MKRLVIYWVIFLGLLLAAMAGWHWLWQTPAGARWAVAQLSRVAPLQVDSVEGRLADRLRLRGVRLQAGQMEVAVHQVDMLWRPNALLLGSVHVAWLELRGLRIEDDRPEVKEAPTFRVPALPAWLTGRRIAVHRLRISDLHYAKGRRPVYRLDELTASLRLRRSVLQARDVRLRDQFGRIIGRLRLGLDEPLLQSQGMWQPLKPGLLDAFYWTVDWESRDQNLAGPAHLVMHGPGRTLGVWSGQWVVEPHAVRLVQTRFRWAGMPGPLWLLGRLDFPQGDPQMDVRAVADWHLGEVAPQLRDTGLVWQAHLRGWLDNYAGRVAISSKGADWRQAVLYGSVAGNLQGLRASKLQGRVLGGQVRGEVAVSWQEAMRAALSMRFSDLDPALVAPAWPGDLNGSLVLSGGGRGLFDRGDFVLELAESRLHQQNFQGRIAADWDGRDLRIAQGHVYGPGMDIRGQGRLAERLNVAVALTELGRLSPQAAGNLRAAGWVRYRAGALALDFSGRGTDLGYGEIRAASARVEGSMQNGLAGPLRAGLALRGLRYGGYALQQVEAAMDGTLEQQRWRARAAWPAGALSLAAESARQGKTWMDAWQLRLGTLTLSDRQTGRWQLPAPATILFDPGDRLRIPMLRLSNQAAGWLRLDADLRLQPLMGQFDAAWQGVPILPVWFPEDAAATVQGRLSGRLQGRILPEQRLDLRGNAAIEAGTLRLQGPGGASVMSIRTAQARFAWAGERLQGDALLDLADAGRADGRLDLALPARLPLTSSLAMVTGRFGLSVQDMPVLPVWFPKGAAAMVQGRMSGNVQGQVLAGQRLDLRGEAALRGGSLQVRRPQGELVAQVRTAQAQFAWAGERLQGAARLDLADYGQASTQFTLPLPARWPLAPVPGGPLRVTGNFRVSEQGLLLVAMPGIVQEGRGDLRGTLDIGGTWAQPRLGGDVRLSGAAAFVPSAGVYVSDIGARLVLAGDSLRLSELHARSGDGTLGGGGTMRLQGFRPAAYSFTITGENFRAIDQPEIEASVSPRLQVQGADGRIQVRGEVLVPHLLLTGTSPGGLRPSNDVVFVDEPVRQDGAWLQGVDLRVSLVLGRDVWVRAQGASARLDGSLLVSLQGAAEPQASGQIRVAEGSYEGYGQKLSIERGLVTFSGALQHPSLNVRAIRKVENVTAGILITGVWPKPNTVLFSNPPMRDADILSYIVLGRPMAAGGGESNLLAQAAGGLLSLGEAAQLRKSLQSGLGLDTFDISPGAGFDRFMVTLGKYINPRIYVSIGRAIFTNDMVVRGRYRMTRNWEVQAESGTQQSGVDLFYTVEMR